MPASLSTFFSGLATSLQSYPDLWAVKLVNFTLISHPPFARGNCGEDHFEPKSR